MTCTPTQISSRRYGVERPVDLVHLGEEEFEEHVGKHVEKVVHRRMLKKAFLDIHTKDKVAHPSTFQKAKEEDIHIEQTHKQLDVAVDELTNSIMAIVEVASTGQVGTGLQKALKVSLKMSLATESTT